jgi:hypothetical protein
VHLHSKSFIYGLIHILICAKNSYFLKCISKIKLTMVIQMDLKISILAILAVLCVLLAACAVSATDDVDQSGDYYFDGYQHDHDGDFIPLGSTNDGSQQAAGGDYYLDGSEDGHNGTIIPPDAGHNEQKMLNQTAQAAGEMPNTNSTNVSTHNASTTHTMPATGNPIIALLAVSALLGGYTTLKRKK